MKIASIFSTAALVLGTLALGVVPWGESGASTITTFSGLDDGVAPSDPFTNSDAARTDFLNAAAAFGNVSNHGFGNQTVGASSGTYQKGNASFAISPLTPPCCIAGVSGVTDERLSPTKNTNGFAAFNKGGQNQNWLGFPTGSVTFTFAESTNSFGAYFTGLDTAITPFVALEITFDDGALQTLVLPTTTKGGVEYFGFTDTEKFSSLTITSGSDDRFGLDGVSFNATETPLPPPWTLMLAGLAGFGLVAHRRTGKRSPAFAIG